MTWADFWALIGTLDGEATQENCQHLAEELSRRSVPDVIGFAERHAEALYRLDQEKFGTLPVVDLTTRDGSPFPQSSDVFLYTRCAVVAAGQTVWESVFFDVDKFAPYTSTEYDGEWGRRATEGGEDRVVATQSIERHVRDPLEGEPPDRGCPAGSHSSDHRTVLPIQHFTDVERLDQLGQVPAVVVCRVGEGHSVDHVLKTRARARCIRWARGGDAEAGCAGADSAGGDVALSSVAAAVTDDLQSSGRY
jgi:hypothetical protein